jgi:hypothetical protein
MCGLFDVACLPEPPGTEVQSSRGIATNRDVSGYLRLVVRLVVVLRFGVLVRFLVDFAADVFLAPVFFLVDFLAAVGPVLFLVLVFFAAPVFFFVDFLATVFLVTFFAVFFLAAPLRLLVDFFAVGLVAAFFFAVPVGALVDRFAVVFFCPVDRVAMMSARLREISLRYLSQSDFGGTRLSKSPVLQTCHQVHGTIEKKHRNRYARFL